MVIISYIATSPAKDRQPGLDCASLNRPSCPIERDRRWSDLDIAAEVVADRTLHEGCANYLVGFGMVRVKEMLTWQGRTNPYAPRFPR